MNIKQRLTAVALAVSMGASAFILPLSAQASEEGKRNTTYALGAAAALLLTQKNKLPGIVAAAGAGYAYTKYNDDVKARHRRERDYGYDDNYNRNRNNNDRYNNDRYNNDRYNNDSYNYDSSYRNNSSDPNCRDYISDYTSRTARANHKRGR